MKSIFVTVGTTSFDQLVSLICTEDILKILQTEGYDKVVLQIGSGKFEPPVSDNDILNIEWFRFKDSIEEDIKQASLVISHAGAGCILETLRNRKPLLVVVNEDLMDNHQLELASQLAKNNHLFYCTCSTLVKTLKGIDFSQLQPLPPIEFDMFPAFIDKVMCYCE